MIRCLSHVNVFVKDQEEAKAFYTEKLDFEVRTDISMEGFRWLTVGPKDQKDLELVLMPMAPGGMFKDGAAETLLGLMDKGVFGAGVFQTSDCRAAYETLKARGVEFSQPPTEQPYGIEAVFKDNSGNWYSLTQRP